MHGCGVERGATKEPVISATLFLMFSGSMMFSFQVGWKMRALAFSIASFAPSENGKPAAPETMPKIVRRCPARKASVASRGTPWLIT